MTEKRQDLLAKIKALLSKTIEAGCTESEAMEAQAISLEANSVARRCQRVPCRLISQPRLGIL
jgi:hypothetical protein